MQDVVNVVIVWRFQTKDGRGVYRAGAAVSIDGGDRHPSPSNPLERNTPLERGLTRDHYFGFRDRAQVLRWFNTKERVILAENGIEVSRFKVNKSHVLYGNYQLAFLRDKAELIDIVRPTEI